MVATGLGKLYRVIRTQLCIDVRTRLEQQSHRLKISFICGAKQRRPPLVIMHIRISAKCHEVAYSIVTANVCRYLHAIDLSLTAASTDMPCAISVLARFFPRLFDAP